jgi:tetratricopeptide (TPR) repeat protein
MALYHPAWKRQAKRVLWLAFLAGPAAGAAPVIAGPAANPGIASLQLHAAAFDLYQQHNLTSLVELLRYRNTPKAAFGRADNKAFLADFFYQPPDLASISPTLIAGRLPDSLLSRDEVDVVLADLYLGIGLPVPAAGLLEKLGDRPTAPPRHSWLNLARYYYRHGYLGKARQALEHLENLPQQGVMQAERDSLSALVDLAANRNDQAIATLRRHDAAGQGDRLDLDRYNLELVLLGENRLDEANAVVQRLTAQSGPDSAGLRTLAAADLGYARLAQHQWDQAAVVLKAVDGDAPYADYARLGAGWAAEFKGDHRGALTQWLPLTQGDPRGEAVQEALLAVPYAYVELQDYEQAQTRYRQAITLYQASLAQLRGARPALTDGRFLDALLAANPGGGEFDAHWRAEKLPAPPAAAWLLPTLSGWRFQAALGNYRDLHIAQDALAAAGRDLDADLSLIARQRKAYGDWQRQLNQGDKDRSPAALAARIERLRSDLQRAEADHDVMMLATADQAKLLRKLKESKRLLDIVKNYIVDYDELYAKYRLLLGLMTWDLTEQYPARLQEARQQLQDLETALSTATHGQDLLTRSADQVIADMNRRESAVRALRTRRAALAAGIPPLLTAQKADLSAQLTRGLDAAETRLEHTLLQARLGLAQAADRAASAAGRDYGAAIAAYGDFLAQGADSPYRRDALLRLATLEMLQADNLDLAQPPKGSTRPGDALYDQAITLLQQALKDYPAAPDNDRVLYNLAKAYDHRGETDAQLDALDRFTQRYPGSVYADEIRFRRGELLFSLGRPRQAAEAYAAIAASSPYYDKARYKLAWSQFKSGGYEQSVDGFLTLLHDKLAGGGELSRGDEELVNDLLRGAALSLAQIKGVDTLADYYARHGAQAYEYRLYDSLARLYLEQQRIEDAADVYRRFVALHPDAPQAPSFDAQVLATYKQGGFTDLLQQAKADFVNRYQPAAAYWHGKPGTARGEVLAKVRDYLHELTRYAHAKAQQSKAAADYRQAEQWYALLLSAFPDDPAAADTHFLYGELLFDDGRYREAAGEYQKVAYDLKDPQHGAEAGYAAALALEKVAGSDQAAQQQALSALQRFAETFPGDVRAAAAELKVAQEWFNRHDYLRAAQAAQSLLNRQPAADPGLRRDAWTLLGLGAFEDRHYADAEQDYRQALAVAAQDDPGRRDMEEHLAAAIYKQGEQARAANDLRTAVKHFLRIAEAAPGTDIAATGQYDAAAALLSLKDWPASIQVLERFRRDYPANPLQKELPAKLAVAYQKVKDWPKAAAELETLADDGQDEAVRRDAVWQSAQLYLRAKQPQEAERMFQAYLRRYPRPAAEAVEAEQQLADLYAADNNVTQQHHWLEQLINTDKHAGAERSERTRLLAGRAALVLAEARYQAFAAIKLTRPLKASLRRKKKAMEAALVAYRDMGEYGIAEITTAATYRAARIYSDLSQAILDSERPKGLSALEQEQYEVLLEEQADPFEEKAIDLYEANARRAADNIYDDNVKRSFAALRKLLPGRYAKAEKGEEYVDAIY